MLADSVNISLVTADRTPSPCFVLLRIGCIGPHCGQEKRELTGWGVTCQTGRNQEREGEQSERDSDEMKARKKRRSKRCKTKATRVTILRSHTFRPMQHCRSWRQVDFWVEFLDWLMP
jgi:hypothetical protein